MPKKNDSFMFKDTFNKLLDCESIFDIDSLSEDEIKYRKRIYNLCKSIVTCYSDLIS